MPSVKLGWWGAWKFTQQLGRNRTVIRPRDFVEREVPHAWLSFFNGSCDMGVRRLGRGLYVLNDEEDPDPIVLIARKYPMLTLGLESALWMHGVIARPEKDWWVTGLRDRAPTILRSTASWVRSSWPQEDRTVVRLGGTMLPAHSVVRALLDCIRFRRRLGKAHVHALLAQALRTEAVTAATLVARAAALRIAAPLKAALSRFPPGAAHDNTPAR